MLPSETQMSQKAGLLQRWRAHFRQAAPASPAARMWRGAAWGGLAALGILLLATAYGMFGKTEPVRFLIGTLLFLAFFAALGLLLTWIWGLLRKIPLFFVWVLACAVPALALMALTTMSVAIGTVLVGLAGLALPALIGASLSGLLGGGWQSAGRLRRAALLGGLALGLCGLLGGAYWLLDDGSAQAAPPNAGALSAGRVTALDLPDPAQPGTYAVRSLTYGSGSDRRRPEFGAQAALITHPVDGSALVEGWNRLRSAYWGFGPQALPLNGRVWYPQGDGPFPLVLIVHGNHPMEDFSDPGYAYLGQLLASRGMIVVSVDENFLNLSLLTDLLIAQSLQDENDLRGWLLLEHLRVWREWNAHRDSPFYQQVDLERIALIGHSRGGEAAAAAAVFNRLPYAPDDARLRFEYHFNIRAVVGIAPVYGSFQPAGQDLVLEDVSYLVLHGAHDMDVFTFQGSRQYENTRFPASPTADCGEQFKAALYIYGANHGQFNTGWGRKDLFEPVMRLFNLEQLMPGDDQRQVAAAAISAFLEAALHDQTEYRAFFQDPRRGGGWLPDGIYLHQYQDACTRLVSTYEEDIDLSSTSLPGGKLSGAQLSLWREQPAQAKWQTFANQTVYLGWDAAETAETASYTVQLPQDGLPVSADSVLVFALADANLHPSPDQPGAKPPANRAPIDLTLELADRAGQTARLPLSHFSLLQPQLAAQLGKAGFMSPFATSEVVLQHFEFALQDFRAANPAFDPAALAEIRFVFDRTSAGVVVLDNLGLR